MNTIGSSSQAITPLLGTETGHEMIKNISWWCTAVLSFMAILAPLGARATEGTVIFPVSASVGFGYLMKGGTIAGGPSTRVSFMPPAPHWKLRDQVYLGFSPIAAVGRFGAECTSCGPLIGTAYEAEFPASLLIFFGDSPESSARSYFFLGLGPTWSHEVSTSGAPMDSQWGIGTRLGVGTGGKSWSLFQRALYIAGSVGVRLNGRSILADISIGPALHF